MSVEKPVFAIITCSDTRGPECDTAGDALESLIEEQGWACRTHMIVKDDRAGIAAAIKRCTDDLKVDIVLTCGGSGLSPRDNCASPCGEDDGRRRALKYTPLYFRFVSKRARTA